MSGLEALNSFICPDNRVENQQTIVEAIIFVASFL